MVGEGECEESVVLQERENETEEAMKKIINKIKF